MNIAKADWLHRESTFLHRWKRNWVVLYTTGELMYYDSPDSREAEERVLMYASCTAIKSGKECNFNPPGGKSKECLIMLQMSNFEDWKLCAESPDDASAWRMTLEEARATNPNVQQPGQQVVYPHTLHGGYVGDMMVNGGQYFTAQPDASKVRVVGPGVEHGILATFISRFIVETKGAGAGRLTVRIRGPIGFQVEMYRDSQRDRTILCKYDPTESGIYIISVKWSGVDIPGSPFHVHIQDTQEELERALNEVSYSIKTGGSHGGSQFSQGFPQRLPYSQWRGVI